MTAADVAYSMRKIMGLEDGVVSARSGWMKEFIDTARADGGLEVVDDRSDVVDIVGHSIEVRNPTDRFEDVRSSVPPQIPTHASIMSQCRSDDSYNPVSV